MIIYKLTFSSGKSYIGQTVKSLEARINQHRNAASNGSPLAVHCAWRKYGDPSSEVLSVHETMDDLHAAEIAAIRSCGTLSPNGYNLGYGGETAPSTNPEVAAKIAVKARGRKASDATRERLSAALSDRWKDPVYRVALADKLASTWTPERRAAAAARGAARKGEKRSDEARQRMTAAAVKSPETRAKMSAAAKARDRAPFSEQTCQRLSAAVAASWQNPEVRERRAAAIRLGHQRRKERLSNAR